ncbi:Dbr1p-like RNA lariat debranching enzyme [Cryptosporidium canis]|uniref:Dbr1p-like RNA lariat debranching enzyme n=1 Tax=Cryptosporidium canis TaxID=195482 RepID=A0ABQ8P727_9CRYT|nr:Dbr1p-like RNA lariat debranching enzyme [Cryptosporidium canis]
MKIAVLGCCHGELNRLYEDVDKYERENNVKVDIIICCGDMQTIRDDEDLRDMAVKSHRSKKGDFWEYYDGVRKAPKLTIFIGGNHETPNVLIPLYYGGWVAPNIFFLGNSGVIRVGDVRIAGISGIYKSYDHYRGYYESKPFSEESKRSWYHIRRFEIQKLQLLENKKSNYLDSSENRKVDLMISHDWPNGIERFGNLSYLLRRKPYLKEDIESGRLGIPDSLGLIEHLRPYFWFSGHHHCFFDASVEFENKLYSSEFRAIDKFKNLNSPVRYFDVSSGTTDTCIYLDLEWLSILRSTDSDLPKGDFLMDKCSASQINRPSKSDVDAIKKNLNDVIGVFDENSYEWPRWDQPNGDYRNLQAQHDFIKSIIR